MKTNNKKRQSAVLAAAALVAVLALAGCDHGGDSDSSIVTAWAYSVVTTWVSDTVTDSGGTERVVFYRIGSGTLTTTWSGSGEVTTVFFTYTGDTTRDGIINIRLNDGGSYIVTISGDKATRGSYTYTMQP